MMSAQPLKPSSDNQPDYSKWQEVVKLAGEFLLQPDLESLLQYILATLMRIFSCEARIWLADSISSMVHPELLQAKGVNISALSTLMQQAFDGRHILPPAEQNADRYPAVIALPLITRDTVLGVIQLERLDQDGFRPNDIALVSDLGQHSSLMLELQIQKNQCTEQGKTLELLYSAFHLVNTIPSNLDESSLVNSVISIIHQRFGFSKVNLFLVQGNSAQKLSCTGISDQGLLPTYMFHFEDERNPVSWVVEHQEVVMVNDTSQDDRFAPSSFDAQTRSELVIPLVSGDIFLGVMDLCSKNEKEFTPDITFVFKSLAESTSVAIRNARLYHAEQLQRQVAERIQHVIGKISADTSLDEVIDGLLVELESTLPSDACAIWLFEQSVSDNDRTQDTPVLRIAAARIREQAVSEEGRASGLDNQKAKELLSKNDDNQITFQSTYPWIIEIANSRQPLTRNMATTREPLGELLNLPGDYSALGMPLHLDDQSLGIIITVSHLPDLYTRESQLIASTFGQYASIGIENTRQYTGTHDQALISTVLLQVAEVVQSATTLADLFDTILYILSDVIGATGCTIYLWDESMDALYPQASYGYETEQQDRLNAWNLYAGTSILVDQLNETKIPVVLNPDNLPDEISTLIFPNYNLQTDLLILFPMIAHGEILGAILVDFSNSTFGKNSSQKMWDDKYTLIQGVTDQTATAIENLQLQRSREEEAYISIALLQVAQAIVSLNQLDEILAAIVRITPILVGIKRCIIYLWDNNNKVLHLAQQYGLAKNELQIIGQDMRLNEFPFIESIMERNQVTYYQLDSNCSPSEWNEIVPEDLHMIEGIARDADEQVSIRLDDNLLRVKARLLIGFPLSVKSEVLGVMLIEEEDPIKGVPSYHIREKRIEIVNGITQQAAIAIKNELLQQEAVKSERMERELQLAREIQSTFLPDHLPSIPGWDMDARWQPAREVGGDFYDVLLLDENHMGFVIADVADKGMPAAMFMTLIRTLIRAAAKDDISPAKVLKHVNELLIPDAKHGMFVTVFYAVFELSSGKVLYANAGHNPPVIKSISSDSLIELRRTSIALGIFPEIEVGEREVTLSPGDWIFLYTDGVTEAFSANDEMFGTKRLFDILSSSQYRSCRELLSLVENAIQEFITGTVISDDVTLAAVCRLGL